ncbi:MAG TPA: amidase, partial [Planctomycetaceae bacterium]|nr:amidase [Planctomycetaceae bacterium]
MNLYQTPPRTIADAQQAIKAGELTCRELLEQCFQNIEEKEPVIHAWAYLDREAAFERADLLDQELQRGRWRGPLHGIPIGIKDIIDVKGMPTRGGLESRDKSPV